VARTHKFLNYGRAYKTGGAGNENTHIYNLVLSRVSYLECCTTV
jgi:hypothetical protein